ncbi:hypothetical protein [Holdemania sp. 1001095H_141210_F2]|uniref:hypothetical protein n=1 Tax=Holdemania sp. 1001095H_141210_F2 TaxID=2787149 RepID=UPI0018A017E9|nr:hypothetical protein [Holdemania sp. 1001095H_141210_F2]
MEQEVKQLFKRLKLGRVCKIIKSDLRWAHGDIYFVTTWTKKYIVYEKDGRVQSIRNREEYFYRRKVNE